VGGAPAARACGARRACHGRARRLCSSGVVATHRRCCSAVHWTSTRTPPHWPLPPTTAAATTSTPTQAQPRQVLRGLPALRAAAALVAGGCRPADGRRARGGGGGAAQGAAAGARPVQPADHDQRLQHGPRLQVRGLPGSGGAGAGVARGLALLPVLATGGAPVGCLQARPRTPAASCLDTPPRPAARCAGRCTDSSCCSAGSWTRSRRRAPRRRASLRRWTAPAPRPAASWCGRRATAGAAARSWACAGSCGCAGAPRPAPVLCACMPWSCCGAGRGL
jgi:hypothetical protein